ISRPSFLHFTLNHYKTTLNERKEIGRDDMTANYPGSGWMHWTQRVANGERLTLDRSAPARALERNWMGRSEARSQMARYHRLASGRHTGLGTDRQAESRDGGVACRNDLE